MAPDPSPKDCLRVPLAEGWVAWVGRSDAANEHLTFRESFPQDWWLHVAGCPGSHVLLRHPDSRNPSREVREAAAGLAAWFSKARKAGTVSVHLARVCDLYKPKGAKTGTVALRKFEVLRVRPQDPASFKQKAVGPGPDAGGGGT